MFTFIFYNVTKGEIISSTMSNLFAPAKYHSKEEATFLKEKN